MLWQWLHDYSQVVDAPHWGCASWLYRDRFHPVRSLGIAILLTGFSLIALLVLPADSQGALLYFAVATSSVLIYGVEAFTGLFNTARIEPTCWTCDRSDFDDRLYA